MSSHTDECYIFVVEWFDPLPALKKQYILKYYFHGPFVEMIDVKSRKTFLKKTLCPPNITEKSFFVGSKFNLLSRDLEIVSYGDNFTKDRLSKALEPCLVLLPSSSYNLWGKIIDEFLCNDISLVTLKSFLFNSYSVDIIEQILSRNSSSNSYSNYSKDSLYKLGKGVSLALYLQGNNIHSIISSILYKFSQQYDTSSSISPSNIATFTSSSQQANELKSLLFDNLSKDISPYTTATLDSCTCVIIKPHSVKNNFTGEIINDIIEKGFEISALRSVFFTKIQAEEFLQVYQGVLPHLDKSISELSSGLSICLEIRAKNAVESFRETCAGPWDPSIATKLFPTSLRGKYSTGGIRDMELKKKLKNLNYNNNEEYFIEGENGVHCTDLPEDGILECEYVFHLL